MRVSFPHPLDYWYDVGMLKTYLYSILVPFFGGPLAIRGGGGSADLAAVAIQNSP